MHKIELSVSKREKTGKQASEAADSGQVPGVVYGKKHKSQPIKADARQIQKIYSEAGTNQVVELTVDDEKSLPVMFKEVQYNAVRGEVRHFDLYAVDMTQTLEADVPVEFVGEAPAEATDAVVVILHDEISVSAKPADLPETFAVDLSQLAEIGDSITIGDVDIPEGVELLSDPEEVLIKVDAPREEEPEPVEEVEGEEGAEGEDSEDKPEGESDEDSAKDKSSEKSDEE